MADVDEVHCINCGGPATPVLRPYAVKRNGKLAVVREVPMLDCDSCGESYMTAEVVTQLDGILGELLAGSNDVTVAHFPEAV